MKKTIKKTSKEANRLRAVCYCRAASVEQAKYGFGLVHQEKMLRAFCDLKGIDLIMMYGDEGHTGTDFNRPEFNKLASFVKNKSNNINLILTLKWDRFGRNIQQAYDWILTFQKVGIKVDTVEQPLDLTNPDNKMMLILYLAAAEVEQYRNNSKEKV